MKNKKSKVCIIANYLTKQGYNRSEAFKKAWQLIKTSEIDTNVVGVTAGRRQTALEHLTRYETELISIELQRDTANEYDSNAIRVITTVQAKGLYCVGFVPKTIGNTNRTAYRHRKSRQSDVQAHSRQISVLSQLRLSRRLTDMKKALYNHPTTSVI